MELGALSDRMKKGIAKATGSDTATRSVRLFEERALPIAIVSTIAGLMANPYATSASVLGIAGIRQAMLMAKRSAIGGTLGAGLDRLARGTPEGLSRLPVAVDRGAEQLQSFFGQP
jgi:crotonobetainyl-CoA:carnitine CoA-transferase CaiB-like acyl-CoA transferase